jgi:GNAT superfamily N-acetyltransferase
MKIPKPMSPNLSLVKLDKVQDKRKWHDRFIKNYKGHTKQASHTIFNDIVSLFFVAKSESDLLGFIRITNYSARYSHLTDQPAWSASDAYVKPTYRNRGVLRFMLEEVITKHFVVSALIDQERLDANEQYYLSLGFSCTSDGPSKGLLYIHQASFKQHLEQKIQAQAQNDDYFNIAA